MNFIKTPNLFSVKLKVKILDRLVPDFSFRTLIFPSLDRPTFTGPLLKSTIQHPDMWHLIALLEHKPCPWCTDVPVLVIYDDFVMLANVDQPHHLCEMLLIRHHVREMSVRIRESLEVHIY